MHQFGKDSNSAELERHLAAIKRDKMNGDHYYNAAVILIYQGMFTPAINYLTTAITLNPKDPSYYINRGCAHASLEEYQLALSDYNTGLGLDPNFGIIHYFSRARVYCGLYRYGEALKDLNYVIQKQPNNTDAIDLRNRVVEEVISLKRNTQSTEEGNPTRATRAPQKK